MILMNQNVTYLTICSPTINQGNIQLAPQAAAPQLHQNSTSKRQVQQQRNRTNTPSSSSTKQHSMSRSTPPSGSQQSQQSRQRATPPCNTQQLQQMQVSPTAQHTAMQHQHHNSQQVSETVKTI